MTGPWKPGMPSPNPGGRTKKQRRDAVAMALLLKGPDGANDKLFAQRLIYICENGEDRDSLTAIKMYFERTLGGVPQPIDLTIDTETERSEIDWSQVPIDERRTMLDTIAKIGALVSSDSDAEH